MTTILVTLIVYKVVLLGIGLFAQGRTKSKEDLYLGGRSLGPLVAAISSAASSSSVWTLLGVSGMAFASGLSALWLFPACVGGFALNWFVLAPRLRRHSAEQQSLTLTDVLAGPKDKPGRRRVVVLASVITLFCLMTYVATQLNGAGKSFHITFTEMSPTSAILIGGAIIVVYTMLGGFWAVSLTDTLQGIIMAATSLVLPIAALIQVGGFTDLFEKLSAVEDAGYFSLIGDHAMIAGIGFVIGLSGITLGYPGQPHVVNRFTALADDKAVRTARRYAMAWALIVYTGMIIVGLCARAELFVDIPDGFDKEQAFFTLAKQLFPDMIYGIMLAAVLSAIMSTADSQLLVCASTVSHDLGYSHANESKQLTRDRLIILVLTAGAVLAAIYGDKGIFDKVLFAWAGAGAAFGPLLLWILWRGPVSSGVAFATMAAGFGTCVVAYTGNKVLGWWNAHGFEHRFLPFAVATLVIVICASRKDREDGSTSG